MYNRGMNFKRNLKSIIALIGSVFMVSSCTNRNAFVKFEYLDPVKDLGQVEDKHEDQVFADGAYTKYGNYASYVAKNSVGKNVELGSSFEVLYNYGGQHIVKAEGKRNIFVLPVQFEDFTVEDLGVSKDEYITNLKKAFFGNSKNNRYASVAEYYNRSSYGKLQIDGMVCDDFYTFPYSVEYIIYNDSDSKIVSGCYNKITSSFIPKHYPFVNFSDYQIESGEITIYLVYTYPTELKQNTKVFWDFTFSEKPMSWSSYSCLNTLAGEPDAHTLIHETGHLLGLPDYYPKVESDPDPTARIDMMDCSVGDHTGFSKMFYDWARPYHVTDSCEITISSLTNYGDLILINDKWNQTVFDEYYLIEFYTPSGLNNFDSNIGNNKAKLPLLPGIKIYHVDARLGYFQNKTVTSSKDDRIFKGYCDVVGSDDPNKTTGNVDYAHTNSKIGSDSTRPTYHLYELQLKGVSAVQDACATDENLYRKGDTFEITPEKFNKTPNASSYKITVTDINYRTATLKIESTKAAE